MLIDCITYKASLPTKRMRLILDDCALSRLPCAQVRRGSYTERGMSDQAELFETIGRGDPRVAEELMPLEMVK